MLTFDISIYFELEVGLFTPLAVPLPTIPFSWSSLCADLDSFLCPSSFLLSFNLALSLLLRLYLELKC